MMLTCSRSITSAAARSPERIAPSTHPHMSHRVTALLEPQRRRQARESRSDHATVHVSHACIVRYALRWRLVSLLSAGLFRLDPEARSASRSVAGLSPVRSIA